MAISTCPFCGQPLTNDAAIEHLQRATARYEAELQGRLTAQAQAAAAKQIEQARQAARTEVQAAVAKRLERLEQDKAELARKSAEAQAAATEQVAQARKAGRADAEAAVAKRERQLRHTVERLEQQKTELERRVDGLNGQDRGDMNEDDIFRRLVEAFPEDTITRTGKGGDIEHIVRYGQDGETKRSAGLILYECKDTLRWSNGFVAQIKADGNAHKTPYLLLVTRAMPRGDKAMSVRDGVVVVDPPHVIYLAHVMRRMVIEAARAGLAGQGKAAKTARLYEYLAGDEFRAHFGAVLDAGATLTAMLQQERRAHERTWTRREQTYTQLERKSVAIDEAIREIVEAEPPASQPHKSGTRQTSKPRRRGTAHDRPAAGHEAASARSNG